MIKLVFKRALAFLSQPQLSVLHHGQPITGQKGIETLSENTVVMVQLLQRQLEETFKEKIHRLAEGMGLLIMPLF